MDETTRIIALALILAGGLTCAGQNAGIAANNPNHPQRLGPVSTVAPLDPTQLEFPEGLAIDKQGNIYAALLSGGRILKFTPDGKKSLLAVLDVGSSGGFLVGLALDHVGDLYVCDTTFEPATHGIWKVDQSGSAHLFVPLDPNGFPNAMAFDKLGNLYVTDSVLSQIYKITPSGQTTVWIADPLLAPGNVLGIGANGIEFDSGYAYVANTDQGSIVRIKVENNPPRPEVYIQDSSLVGADGIAFDLLHNLYVVLDIQNNLVRIYPNRTITRLATAANGLDYPASTSFGESLGQRKFLFWTNAGVNFGKPSIQKLDVSVPGVPLP